jgi:hypothetical protein
MCRIRSASQIQISVAAGFTRQRSRTQAKLRSMKAMLLGKLRSALTLALVLWCGGAGCMMVSYAHGVPMNEAEAAHASGPMGAHDCCKAAHAAERGVPSPVADRTVSSESLAYLEKLGQVPNSSNAFSCCPLTSGSIVVTGRQRVSDDGASLGPDVEAISCVPAGFTTPVVRLPNQEQTYLRGCVFLI